jgi:hypothetical protein
MTELTCQQCQELAAELALDVLPCHDRGRMLAHLEGCTTCQDTVSALTVTADRLVQLLPAVEPPAGFEQRVINALTPPPRARRRWIPAAAGWVALALATGGWIVGRATHDLTPTPIETQAENNAQAGERTVLYAPLTAGGPETAEHQIGQAYLYPGSPPWIYLSLDTNSTITSDTVRCEVIRRDGSTVQVGTLPLTHGHAAWGGPAPVDRDTPATARLINRNGRTLAKAHFTPPPNKSRQPPPPSHTKHQRHHHS